VTVSGVGTRSRGSPDPAVSGMRGASLRVDAAAVDAAYGATDGAVLDLIA
jgi:hypothetical protein